MHGSVAVHFKRSWGMQSNSELWTKMRTRLRTAATTGFYIHSNVKMRYKGEFGPAQLLCPRTHSWCPLAAAKSRLGARYAVLGADADEEVPDACAPVRPHVLITRLRHPLSDLDLPMHAWPMSSCMGWTLGGRLSWAAAAFQKAFGLLLRLHLHVARWAQSRTLQASNGQLQADTRICEPIAVACHHLHACPVCIYDLLIFIETGVLTNECCACYDCRMTSWLYALANLCLRSGMVQVSAEDVQRLPVDISGRQMTFGQLKRRLTGQDALMSHLEVRLACCAGRHT